MADPTNLQEAAEQLAIIINQQNSVSGDIEREKIVLKRLQNRSMDLYAQRTAAQEVLMQFVMKGESQ